MSPAGRSRASPGQAQRRGARPAVALTVQFEPSARRRPRWRRRSVCSAVSWARCPRVAVATAVTLSRLSASDVRIEPSLAVAASTDLVGLSVARAARRRLGPRLLAGDAAWQLYAVPRRSLAGLEATLSVPPSSSARSRIPSSPKPRDRADVEARAVVADGRRDVAVRSTATDTARCRVAVLARVGERLLDDAVDRDLELSGSADLPRVAEARRRRRPPGPRPALRARRAPRSRRAGPARRARPGAAR